jgi:hypothetical protein
MHCCHIEISESPQLIKVTSDQLLLRKESTKFEDPTSTSKTNEIEADLSDIYSTATFFFLPPYAASDSYPLPLIAC